MAYFHIAIELLDSLRYRNAVVYGAGCCVIQQLQGVEPPKVAGIELRCTPVLMHSAERQGADFVRGFRGGKTYEIVPGILLDLLHRRICLQINCRAYHLPRQHPFIRNSAQVVHTL